MNIYIKMNIMYGRKTACRPQQVAGILRRNRAMGWPTKTTGENKPMGKSILGRLWRQADGLNPPLEQISLAMAGKEPDQETALF